MKCNDFQELIDSYLSDELLTETNHDVLRHLEQCAGCRQVIENRREFRGKLRSAVMNAQEFQICDKFCANLRQNLKQSLLPKKQPRKIFWSTGNAWAAVAASLIFMFAFGVWYFQLAGGNQTNLEIVSLNPTMDASFIEDAALGDHLDCAINHSLDEKPVKIDLESPRYTNLKEGVLQPLQVSSDKYEIRGAHDCKIQERVFTHFIFETEGKTLSVIMLDLENYKSLESDKIVRFKSDEYQLARFDVDNKAVFVISDLPEEKNSATAELLVSPMNKKFPDDGQTAVISEVVHWY